MQCRQIHSPNFVTLLFGSSGIGIPPGHTLQAPASGFSGRLAGSSLREEAAGGLGLQQEQRICLGGHLTQGFGKPHEKNRNETSTSHLPGGTFFSSRGSFNSPAHLTAPSPHTARAVGSQPELRYQANPHLKRTQH